MQIAIIDLGTNTFNLLITEVDENNQYTILVEDKYPSKIGKGGINKNTITPEAFDRGFKALETHLDTISKYNVEQIACFATAAIRSASNGKTFVSQVKEKFDLDINVIQGDKEAELIFDGVKQVVPIGKEKVLIMDIGGGSTEFIIANKDGIVWKYSFNVGAARMLDLVQPSEPIKSTEIKILEEYINNELQLLYTEMEKHEVKRLIGSSGSFDTIAAMVAAEEHPHLDFSKTTSYKIELDLFDTLHQKYLESTIEERLKMKKMEPHRVEMIVLASAFIQFIIDKLDLTEIYQCNYALKEGAIYQILNKKI